MTENEAIIELQQIIDLPYGYEVSDEAAKIAIKALEEIQQYRAIGTVEELQKSKCKYWNIEYEDCTLNNREIENKAIDEFAEKVNEKISEFVLEHKDNLDFASGISVVWNIVDEVAEQMKGGEE